jgi:hypothetical protein
MSINWNNIRPLGSSQNDAFEELIRQLARRENIENKLNFVPLGRPDAGVECFWILNNEEEWGWQAKFFTTSLTITQRGEIDDSVKTAIEKHPRLKKYVVALPIDPPDARLKNQKSLLLKWNERVKKWESWAKSKGKTIIFEPWWSSDIIYRLSQPENVGLTYFFFNKEEFTDKWFFEQADFSIDELGERYTPKINMKLEISRIFDAVARDEKFEKQITTIFDTLFVNSKKVNTFGKEMKNQFLQLKGNLDELYNKFRECNFKGVDALPFIEFGNLLDSINSLVESLQSHFVEIERGLQEKRHENRYFQKYGHEISSLQELSYSIDAVRDFIFGVSGQLSNKPILLLDGEAGIGKSHLIADVVKNRSRDGKASLLFLGQHFVTDEDPWLQISKKLHLNCTLDEFLGALNSKAEIAGSRLILFIDAINEGRGRYFWGDNIRGFIKRVEKYKWLGLVFSVRDSYKKLFFPSAEWTEESIVQYTHYGFRGVEYEAAKMFFSAYRIQLPNVPLLHPEFQKPLFLRLVCEGLKKSGYTKIPDGLQGITSIINFFVNGVNLHLSQANRFDYPNSINVVKKAINILIVTKIDKNLRYIPYEVAYTLLENLMREYSSKKGFLDELISEGVLSKNIFWQSNNSSEEGVYLVYEKFEDHLTATFLLDRVLNPIERPNDNFLKRFSRFLLFLRQSFQKKTRLDFAFSPKGELFHFVQDEHACRMNKGLLEAFSIQLPEKSGKEFYEYVPHLKEKYPVVESFVQSLLWRNVETDPDNLREYIKRFVFSYRGTYELFWETVLSVAAIPDHYFNAYLLHRNLMSFSLPDRDASWTVYLKDKDSVNSAVMRLIDWAWGEHDKNYISDESAKLAAMTLAWFHTSTNRKLRDSATKALICLLENRIHILIDVLNEFSNVNDPYVRERLFAVAYGCATRTQQKNALKNLSLHVYEIVFSNDNEVYLHILLRDYARGVIECAFSQGLIDDQINMDKVRPPYKSLFIKEYPTNEEIDSRYRFNYEAKDFKDYYWAQNNILDSMTTEYGRGTGGYGDFGRYVFQRALENWDADVDGLSNLAVMWIFDKYGYDVEKHGKFDREIGSGRSRATENERIGKKYQWLAFHEILAMISDHCSKFAEWDYKNHSTEPYEGAWDPNVRDIDPTIVIKTTGEYDEDAALNYWWIKENYSRWAGANKEWTKQNNDLPSLEKLISFPDDSDVEWIALESHIEWTEPKPFGVKKYDLPHKILWFQIRSYLVKRVDYKRVKLWMSRQSFMGRWMPESHERFEVFNREYYWSPAYKYFQKEYYDGGRWRSLMSRKHDKSLAQVIVTCENYFWEEGFDQSKEKPLSFLKPCLDVYEKMGMSCSDKEGEFVNAKGEVICFDPSVYHDCKPSLLVRKQDFLDYLKENELCVVWTVLGEKIVTGDWHSSKKDYPGRQEINGLFYLNADNIVTGNTRSDIT